MSDKRLRVRNTDIGNLISNLRGEFGEIVFAWVLMRNFTVQAAALRTEDTEKDLENRQLVLIDALADKLSDEVVARLAELAERKVGRLTFHFAHLKLQQLDKESSEFTRFIESNRFREKRNYDISHKELPEKWTDHKTIHIPYKVIVEGIVRASRLMKKIDTLHLGPRAKYLWREMRKRRYQTMYPAKVGYMLLPYLRLSAEDRLAIIKEEAGEGRDGWKDMLVRINGKATTVRAYGEMGAIVLGGQVMLLDEPFVELTSIDFPPKGGNSAIALGISSE